MKCEHCGTDLVITPPFEVATYGMVEVVRCVSVSALRSGLPLVEQVTCDESPNGVHGSPALSSTRCAR